ncbi:MAG: hypothetical protein U9N77_07505 [Thermodesulfobacteriota bacterium]|nr:hypothetical protein [Thermodesulfobacteriota bacterium]
MLRYIVIFAAGFVTGKVVTNKNVEAFKKAGLKSYIVVKDKFSKKETQENPI